METIKKLERQGDQLGLDIKKIKANIKSGDFDPYELQEAIHEILTKKGIIEGLGRAIHAIKQEEQDVNPKINENMSVAGLKKFAKKNFPEEYERLKIKLLKNFEGRFIDAVNEASYKRLGRLYP